MSGAVRWDDNYWCGTRDGRIVLSTSPDGLGAPQGQLTSKGKEPTTAAANTNCRTHTHDVELRCNAALPPAEVTMAVQEWSLTKDKTKLVAPGNRFWLLLGDGEFTLRGELTISNADELKALYLAFRHAILNEAKLPYPDVYEHDVPAEPATAGRPVEEIVKQLRHQIQELKDQNGELSKSLEDALELLE